MEGAEKYAQPRNMPSLRTGCCCGIRWMEAVTITVSICSMLSSVLYTYIYVRGQQATIFNEIHNEYASADIMEAFDTLEQFLAATGDDKYAEEYMRLKMLPREEYLKGKATGKTNILASLFSSNSAVTTDAALGRQLDLSRRRLLHYLGKLLMFNNWGYLTDSMMHEFPGRARAMHAISLLQPLVTHTARAYNFEDHQRVLDGIQAIYNISINPEDRVDKTEFRLKLAVHPRGEPLVFVSGDWRPICGHWFWNTEDGAISFCQALGYSSGVNHRTKHKLNASAVLIGPCNAGERIGSCTGVMRQTACQRNSVGCGSCAWGDSAGVEVECSGGGSGSTSAMCLNVDGSGECRIETPLSSSETEGTETGMTVTQEASEVVQAAASENLSGSSAETPAA